MNEQDFNPLNIYKTEEQLAREAQERRQKTAQQKTKEDGRDLQEVGDHLGEESSSVPYTDIQAGGWISRLPAQWQPYAILMRLDRPIGWWLLLLPAWWGIMLGANGITGMYASDWRLMILFLLGAVIMRGAGCIINDLWDRDLDKQVERTKMRPLASGQIPMFNAIVFLFFILFTAFIILLQTSWVTIGLGMLSLVFVASYPLMKRITWWPQAFLGLTFNFGALMGWAAATHRLGWEAFLLYAAGFFWTLGYDTIYAHQDKQDDALVGIKSTALLFGENSKFWIGIFYTLSIGLIAATLLVAGFGILSFVFLIFPAIHLFRQVSEWEMNDPENSLQVFKSNRNFGLLVLLSISVGGVSLPLDKLLGSSISEFSQSSLPSFGF